MTVKKNPAEHFCFIGNAVSYERTKQTAGYFQAESGFLQGWSLVLQNILPPALLPAAV